jgi:excisionase family DNA binding protein
MLTTRQAAAELHITVRRVQAMIRAGRLTAHKVGRDWLINASEIDRVRIRTNGRPKKNPK